jgi:gamma-glutamyltranspeptidase / glutathione hydrolase
MVLSRRGIVATSQPLASQAGAQILAKGGSAADAAIAANAVLGVIEPMMCGIGGDLFAIYYEAKSGKLTGLNASGPAPLRLTPEFLNASRMPETGIHTVTVPGAVDGWAKMHARFGKLPWRQLFEAALVHAVDCFPVPEIVHELWSNDAAIATLRSNPQANRVFLPNGHAPREGELFRNIDLLLAYGAIAKDGPESFYTGEIGTAILKASQELGGTMTAADLANFSAEWVEPISVDYRGWRVFELPPNGQGMAALEMLNIMEALGCGKEGPTSASELHRRIESMKLAYADVYHYNADPRSAHIPVAELLSKSYAAARAKLVDPDRANGGASHGNPPTANTVYLTAVDREGNIASWIQSIYSSFGSGVTVMGFPLQSRGAGFTLEPGHPNRLAGGKRPYHTIIPGFLQRGDHHVGFGIMGGANQPLAHAQFVSNVVDYGMTLQQAMEAPRFFKGSATGCDVSIESRVPETSLRELASLGHQVTLRAEYSQEMGRGQAILHDASTSVNYAASDPRSDGCAIPE